MPAQVLAITEEQRTPKAREQRLVHTIAEAYKDFHTELERYEDSKLLKSRFETYEYACGKLSAYWEHRARTGERALRRVLDKDLTDEQFDVAVKTLFAQRADRHNPKLLSDYESQIVQQYRRMDTAAKQMIRTLFERLAATGNTAS